MSARDRSLVIDNVERQLRFQPAKVNRSRIKRLRDLRHPQFRLRVGEICVFYDISDGIVEVLAIVPKSRAGAWLERYGQNAE